jgi:hypothetical protein
VFARSQRAVDVTGCDRVSPLAGVFASRPPTSLNLTPLFPSTFAIQRVRPRTIGGSWKNSEFSSQSGSFVLGVSRQVAVSSAGAPLCSSADW